jgi:hypothetical protein
MYYTFRTSGPNAGKVLAVTRTVWIVTAPIKAAKVQLGGFLFLALMHQELFSLFFRAQHVVCLKSHEQHIYGFSINR